MCQCLAEVCVPGALLPTAPQGATATPGCAVAVMQCKWGGIRATIPARCCHCSGWWCPSAGLH